MNKVVITVRGGVVQSVHSDQDIEIHVVDYDTDGHNKESLGEYAEDLLMPRQRDTNNPSKYLLEAYSEFIDEAMSIVTPKTNIYEVKKGKANQHRISVSN